MIQLPIIGAFLEAAGMILEKKILKNKKMNFKNYTAYEFLAIVIVMIPIAFLTWRILPGAFSILNIFIFALIILISVAANLLIFYSLKRETVTEFEPIWLMQPFFVIMLAFIFFESERKILLLLPALIASIALFAAHIKKHHISYNKYMLATALGSFLFAVELILSKPILQYYNPFTFYFIRCFFIFVVCFIIFKPLGKELKDKKIVLMTLIIGLMWTFYRAIMYYGYESLGVIYTTTLFILSPSFIFIFATIFLKEKPTLKHIISTIIITACVVASILLNS